VVTVHFLEQPKLIDRERRSCI